VYGSFVYFLVGPIINEMVDHSHVSIRGRGMVRGVVLAMGGGRIVSVWVVASEVVGGVTIVMFSSRSRLF
jgi:hypothetical protein